MYVKKIKFLVLLFSLAVFQCNINDEIIFLSLLDDEGSVLDNFEIFWVVILVLGELSLCTDFSKKEKKSNLHPP